MVLLRFGRLNPWKESPLFVEFEAVGIPNVLQGWRCVVLLRFGRLNPWKESPLFVEFEAAWIPNVLQGWRCVVLLRFGRLNPWKESPLFVEFEAAWIPNVLQERKIHSRELNYSLFIRSVSSRGSGKWGEENCS